MLTTCRASLLTLVILLAFSVGACSGGGSPVEAGTGPDQSHFASSISGTVFYNSAPVASGHVFAYDLETYEEIIPRLLDHAEEMTRREIEKMPDGVYSFEDYLDNDGIDMDRRIFFRLWLFAVLIAILTNQVSNRHSPRYLGKALKARNHVSWQTSRLSSTSKTIRYTILQTKSL